MRVAASGNLPALYRFGGGGSDTNVSASVSTFVSDDYDILANSTATATFTITAKNGAGSPLSGKTATIARESIAVSAGNSLVSVSTPSVEINTPVTVTVTVRDGSNRPVPNIAASDIAVSSTGTGNTIGAVSGPTNQSGQTTCTFESEDAEVKTISATVLGTLITDTATLTVNDTALVSASASSFTSDDYDIPADGSTTATFTITARNVGGDPVSGVSASIARESIAVSAANSIVIATPSEIDDDGVDSATVSVTVRDGSNRPIPNLAAADVVIAVSGTGNTVTQPAAATDQNGQTTGSFVSTVAESKTVSVTVLGTAITDTASVDVTGTPSEPAADFEVTWAGVTDQTSAEAVTGWLDTDYTYWGGSDGLSVVTTDGSPGGSGVCIQSNIPIGSQGFSSGGGFGLEFARGTAPCEEAWIEIWAKPAVGFDPTGTGGGNPDYKALFNAGGNSYAGGTGTLISTGRSTIAKWGNNGSSFLDRIYTYPNTSFDSNYAAMPDDVGNLGWTRYRVHDRMGTGATNGIFTVEVTPDGGSPVVVSETGYTPSSQYMGYLTLGNNLNQFISSATSVRWGNVKVWLAGNDPGWGF